MTLDQLASLGEIVAAVAVVATLIYVAKQLGQNTAMMRASASDQRVKNNAELSFRVADSQEFADIWRRGGSDYQGLEETERIRIALFNQQALVHWQNMFRLRAQRLLPDEDWNEFNWMVRYVGRRQDVQAAWGEFRGAYDASFQEFVDSKLPNGRRDCDFSHSE